MSNVLLSIAELLSRDLAKLKEEIGLYQSSDALWIVDGEIKNSAGNLCLHLCGNLQHFIGAILGKTSYIRNREAEFSTKNMAKDSLLNEIEATIRSVEQTLATLSDGALEIQYPQDVLGKPMTTGYFLIHLQGHLNYHLGQINYHRRLLDK